MRRGGTVWEISTGRKATVVFVWPNGTESHSEPWAKIMFGLGTGGVGFCARDLSELTETEPVKEEPARVLITSSGHIFHTRRDCRGLRRATEIHSIPRRDAEIYFGRNACYICEPIIQGKGV